MLTIDFPPNKGSNKDEDNKYGEETQSEADNEGQPQRNFREVKN